MALADTARLVASLELEDKFSRPAAAAEASLGRLTDKTSTLGRVAGETRRGLGNLAGNLRTIGTIAAGAAVAGIAFSIRAASDLEESMAKVNVVFGEGAAEVEAWAATAADAFGQSKQQALEAAGTFGNLFQAFGVARPEAQAMSTELVELASDLASFNNTEVQEALDALRSGLSGETEPLKRYGAAISDVRIRQEALRRGLIKTTKDALTPAVKAQAIYTLILQDTALAQGDFARTAGGLANQQRILRANLQDTASVIGTALLPQVTKLTSQLVDLLVENRPAIEQAAAQLPQIFDAVTEIAGNLPWSSIGDAFRLMGTGSKALLDAFTGLPPWVQTAVLTGWGLNKLTGGALTGIAGALASGLIKGVLGINAGVVNINAATVNGGTGTGVGGGAGNLVAGALGTAGVAGTVTGGILTVGDIQKGTEEGVERGIVSLSQGPFTGLIARAIEEVMGDPIGDLIDQNRRSAVEAASQSRLQEHVLRENSARISDSNRELITNRHLLANIASKNFSPIVKATVNVTSNVSITDITRRLVSQRIATSGTGGITIE